MSTLPARLIAGLMAVEHVISSVSVWCGCVMMAAAACVGFYQVLTRFIFNEPATWSEPFIRMTLIWMAYLGLAGAVRAGALVSVDFLYRMSRGPWRRALDGAVALATLSLLGLLFWFGWDLAYRVRFQNLAGLEIPISYAYSAIPVGSLIAMLSVVAHYFDPRREELETAV